MKHTKIEPMPLKKRNRWASYYRGNNFILGGYIYKYTFICGDLLNCAYTEFRVTKNPQEIELLQEGGCPVCLYTEKTSLEVTRTKDYIYKKNIQGENYGK